MIYCYIQGCKPIVRTIFTKHKYFQNFKKLLISAIPLLTNVPQAILYPLPSIPLDDADVL